MKKCTVCKAEKEPISFYACKASKDGKSYRCKYCDDIARATWKENNPEKAKLSAKYRNLKMRYGITEEEYETLMEDSGNSCAICARSDVRLVVDHCHESDKVRGILCNSCNRALGYFGDDSERMIAGANYIYRFKAETH